MFSGIFNLSKSHLVLESYDYYIILNHILIEIPLS